MFSLSFTLLQFWPQSSQDAHPVHDVVQHISSGRNSSRFTQKIQFHLQHAESSLGPESRRAILDLAGHRVGVLLRPYLGRRWKHLSEGWKYLMLVLWVLKSGLIFRPFYSGFGIKEKLTQMWRWATPHKYTFCQKFTWESHLLILPGCKSAIIPTWAR